MRDVNGEVWWCNTHQRQAIERRHWNGALHWICSRHLGGILLPCRGVNITGIVEIDCDEFGIPIGSREHMRREHARLRTEAAKEVAAFHEKRATELREMAAEHAAMANLANGINKPPEATYRVPVDRFPPIPLPKP